MKSKHANVNEPERMFLKTYSEILEDNLMSMCGNLFHRLTEVTGLHADKISVSVTIQQV